MRTYSNLFFGLLALAFVGSATPSLAESADTDTNPSIQGEPSWSIFSLFAGGSETKAAIRNEPEAKAEETPSSLTKSSKAFVEPKGASSIRALIARHAAANGVPFALADAVVKVESRYNPNARNGPSFGLAQINLQTARGLGYSGGGAGLLNANTNLTYAMRYLAEAYRLAGGDTCGTVMRYQNGTASRHFTGANRAYCAKVKSHFSALGFKKHTT